MPLLNSRLPKYSKHRASGQAVVTLGGVDHYLGPHDTKASHLEYDRLLAEWLANGRRSPASDPGLTIVELLAAFRRHALEHYRKNGKPTRSLRNIDDAIRPVRLLYGREQVCDFGPLKLQSLQRLMVTGYRASDGRLFAGMCRSTVNKRVGIVKQVFRWAVSQEMAPPSLSHALDTVRGLQRGRTEAREMPPVSPVSDSVVTVTLEHLPAVVAGMVRFQRLTGCRPSEACCLRPADVDRTGDVWTYRPESHKTEHQGRERVIFIGPQAQAVLLPYLLRNPQSYCFSPQESERTRHGRQREARKTAVQPSQQNRGKKRPKRSPRERYDKDSYGKAIARACRKAGVDPWAPNRLRHSRATEVRKRFGLEAAQIALGHSRADVTQVYAERDGALGITVARQIG
jgi:integrase